MKEITFNNVGVWFTQLAEGLRPKIDFFEKKKSYLKTAVSPSAWVSAQLTCSTDFQFAILQLCELIP